MRPGIIATWRMALDGVRTGIDLLTQGESISRCVESAIMDVEDNPLFHSVGYGGLPNRHGVVELDAAWMDGDTLGYGAVMAVQGIRNPVRAARLLSRQQRNNVLAAQGALQFAIQQGLPLRDHAHPLAQRKWRAELTNWRDDDEQCDETREAYDGHDTVCILGVDEGGSMVAGVSTSGLFMKYPGRVGDSPVIGAGCYADSHIGAAAATGVGEEIMKGCLSYEIVRLMEQGVAPQTACEQALFRHHHRLAQHKPQVGRMSVIALRNDGTWGAATNKTEFSFVAGDVRSTPQVWLAQQQDEKCCCAPAPQAWLDEYARNLAKGSGN